MELVEGQPLSTLLADGRRDGRKLDRDVVRDLMAQAGDALGVAHAAGIVHRDVKPANLMVTSKGQVKITDFGIARAAEGVGVTMTGAVMGTPQYLSPEQARGDKASSASDVYSLGVVTFECLAGERPFDAGSPVATALAHIQQDAPPLPDDVPADLARVVQRSLSKDASVRYADGTAFAAALRDPSTEVIAQVPADGPAHTTVMPPVAPIPTPAPVRNDTLSNPVSAPTSPRKKSPWGAILLVLLLVAVAVLATMLLTQGDDDPTEPTGQDTTASQTQSSEPTTSEPTETTTTTSEAATISVNSADYVGRDIKDVESELRDLGLKVSKNKIENDGTHLEGEVAGVNPTGELMDGDPITVDYYDKAKKDETEPPPTETEPPPPTDTETEVTP